MKELLLGEGLSIEVFLMNKNQSRLGDFIAVVGLLLSSGGFYIDNVYFFIIGIIVVLLYALSYINEKFIKPLKNTNNNYQKILKDISFQKEINKVKERVSFLEGRMSMLNNKRGVVNPIILIIIILVLILLIQFLKDTGVL